MSPRRVVGLAYLLLAALPAACKQPPQPTPAPSRRSAGTNYELQDVSFKYEFSSRADETFLRVHEAMRAVSIGFAVHAVAQVSALLHDVVTMKEKQRLLGVGGCIDEALYSYYIWEASLYFKTIATTSGRDIENLMDGMHAQQKLWKRMRNPLFVQTALMLLGILWRVKKEWMLNAAGVVVHWLHLPGKLPVLDRLLLCKGALVCDA